MNEDRELNESDKEKRIEEYSNKVQRFKEELQEDKEKILKKFGVSNIKELRKEERKKKK